MLIACMSSFGQNMTDLTNLFKSKPNAQYMIVPQGMLKMLVGQMMDRSEVSSKMSKMNASKDDINKIVEKIDSVVYLSLDDCSEDVKTTFNDKTKDISSYGYNKVSEETGKGSIYSKEKNGNVSEVIVFINQGGNCDFIQFFGNIKPDDVSAILNKVSNLKL